MRAELELHRDDGGNPRATPVDPTFSLLARFLEGELQGSIALCDELLKALDALEAGTRDAYEDVGNALSLRVDRAQACLETEVGEAVATLALPTEIVRDAVLRWRRFLRGDAVHEKGRPHGV